ncbi:MAG: SDR family oxidoreductase [Burkholderiaceae bacterium]|jgi:3-oxoacyl-[acyl-carrier protein] reductase|nr:SDR family oxidoreductase [Burkholderiaceae bacterium]MCU0963504.1 SDR family oxidoreductase [Burkholderiaceae bacterium]
MSKPLALVFGGTRGIGAACVEALLRDGYDVAYTATSGTSPLAARGPGRSAGYAVDVRDAAAVAKVFADAGRDFGVPVQAVVANAGINRPPGPLAQYADENFRDLVEVNLVGAFNVLREAARQVSDGGSIVALTTSMVRTAPGGVGAYTATKAAVEVLVRALSKELAPRKVRVNAVAPGPVDTELFRAGKTDEMIARSAALSPFNRVGEPQEVAEVVSFVVSQRASWVDGQIVQPNGGMV